MRVTVCNTNASYGRICRQVQYRKSSATVVYQHRLWSRVRLHGTVLGLPSGPCCVSCLRAPTVHSATNNSLRSVSPAVRRPDSPRTLYALRASTSLCVVIFRTLIDGRIELYHTNVRKWSGVGQSRVGRRSSVALDTHTDPHRTVRIETIYFANYYGYVKDRAVRAGISLVCSIRAASRSHSSGGHQLYQYCPFHLTCGISLRSARVNQRSGLSGHVPGYNRSTGPKIRNALEYLPTPNG